MAEYAEGVTEISPVLADAIGLRREIVPQNKFLLRIGWGEGGRRPDEVSLIRTSLSSLLKMIPAILFDQKHYEHKPGILEGTQSPSLEFLFVRFSCA